MSDFEAEWQAWHDTREERLRGPDSWMAITAIHWLSTTPEGFDDVPGAWSGDERGATVTLGPGELLTVGTEVLTEGEHLLGPLDENGLTVTFEDASAEVADRGGRTIVRPMHPGSPNLLAYDGTPCFPPSPSWVLPGRFEPYSTPRGEAVGEVAFPYDGTEHRLVAWDGDDGTLWILFRDATTGVTTHEANRQLVTTVPTPEGAVLIDFNRAINMPCAYTDFATCPLPPTANTLPFAVEAGEMIPAVTPPRPTLA
ncbi:DUF1684 domain-containing protein [Marmoricola sp. RAF53]|uniref:DUF1684 domain-containing protein n=1 Tax=Marmoricola sp. RAF53 TaxID=3233059 RepID=UPI003F993644